MLVQFRILAPWVVEFDTSGLGDLTLTRLGDLTLTSMKNYFRTRNIPV